MPGCRRQGVCRFAGHRPEGDHRRCRPGGCRPQSAGADPPYSAGCRRTARWRMSTPGRRAERPARSYPSKTAAGASHGPRLVRLPGRRQPSVRLGHHSRALLHPSHARLRQAIRPSLGRDENGAVRPANTASPRRRARSTRGVRLGRTVRARSRARPSSQCVFAGSPTSPFRQPGGLLAALPHRPRSAPRSGPAGECRGSAILARVAAEKCRPRENWSYAPVGARTCGLPSPRHVPQLSDWRIDSTRSASR